MAADDSDSVVRDTPDTVASGRAEGGAAVARPAESLAASTLPGILYAALFAVGIVTVETVITLFAGSYLAWRIIILAAVFWTAAATVAGAALAIAAMPALLIVKGRFRAAILPSLIAAGGYAVCVVDIGGNYSVGPAQWKELLLGPAFIAAASLALAAATALLAARDAKSRRWAAIVFVTVAILSAAGMSSFIPERWAAVVLAVGPFALTAVYGVFVEITSWARTRVSAFNATAALAAAAALTVALGVVAPLRGELALRPLGNHQKIDAGKAAMLAGRPNVILIVMDTVRADHTSLCGYKYPTTPNLVQLAKDGRLYPKAEAVDSWTLPSHASMFTGKYPRQHGAHASSEKSAEGIEKYRPYGTQLAPSQKTIAWYLSQAGYSTGGIAANYTWLCRQFGLDQGFGYYYDLPRMLLFMPNGSPVFKLPLETVDEFLGYNGKLLQTYWDAETVTHMAESWVAGHKAEPFFLFVNYMDAHYPYSAMPPFDHIDGPDIPYDPILRQHSWQKFLSYYINTGKNLTPARLRSMINQYDGEIAYADHWIGSFVESLKREGLYDNTLLIVTSDHGEFLGEHRLLNHGVGLYEGGINVPILVKYPEQQFAGQVVDERVSLIDIFATIAEAARVKTLEVPSRPLGAGPSGQIIIAEDYENGMNLKLYGDRFKGARVATFDKDWKLMKNGRGGSELFDLSRDPGEYNDRSKSASDVAARLDKAIAEWQATTELFDGTKEANREMTKEGIEKLKSIGYFNN